LSRITIRGSGLAGALSGCAIPGALGGGRRKWFVKKAYRAIVSQAYEKLHGELAAFLKATGKTCPKCGKAMLHRVKPGKGGYDFWGCSGYPDCKEKL